ncbi:MAG: DUF1015 family protein [Candidatus Eremiobacteraeota bacterium]|nr:DUF1015 family protein [Candidatus Eremiobacteraeota bacterium]
MAVVKPFRAVRPRKDNVIKVACPPYDVISSEEARAMAEGNDMSLLHVTKPEIDLEPRIDHYDERVYEKGKENLQKFLRENILTQDSNDCFYLYRQIMPLEGREHTQLGLVACASVDEYQSDLIKKHELTRKDKEDDRTKHVYITQANTGPVFLTYKSREALDRLLGELEKGKPEYDFTSDDGIHHIVWVIDREKDINAIIRQFEKIPVMYVADGHHRSASACRVREIMKVENASHTGKEEYNFFLVVIFPHDQMNIMAYNRVVKTLNNHSADDFLKKITELFEVMEMGPDLPSPEKRHQFGMYLNGKGYLLTAGQVDESDPVLSLDVSILQNTVLSPLLGIKEPREDKNIDFIGGIRGTGELKRLVESGKFKVAFSLYPTSIEDLIGVADSGKIMPPKSTWFEPKLKDGIAIHMLKN